MTVTRDPEFPAKTAQLMAAMNACCDGHTMDEVLRASANMTASAITNSAEAMEMTDADFQRYAWSVAQLVGEIAILNWKRAPKPEDVPVKQN